MKILSVFKPNPLDQILKKAIKKNQSRFLIIWNRGLGDIALGLYALKERIRSFIPKARITFLTRSDLAEGFKLLSADYLTSSGWERGKSIDIDKTLEKHGLKREDFDLILERPDPTKWLHWQLGKMVPKLKWNPDWDRLCETFHLGDDRSFIGAQVDTETGQYYGYEKNWPKAYWKELLAILTRDYKRKVLLFGLHADDYFKDQNVIDLRGRTSLFELIAIIKNYCSHLIVPDSGVLSTIYYVDSYFPIKMVSLWSDSKQGVLRQRVDSPNKGLKHIPLIGKNKKMVNIKIKDVIHGLFS